MNTVTGQCEDMVLVPRKPTKEMIQAASDAALAEDAAWVWSEMLQSFEKSSHLASRILLTEASDSPAS